MLDQPVSLSGDPQPMVPQRILHRGERSCPWKFQACRYLVISQNRALFADEPVTPPASPRPLQQPRSRPRDPEATGLLAILAAGVAAGLTCLSRRSAADAMLAGLAALAADAKFFDWLIT